ncbi:MAG: translation initiation factor IF-5A [Candidatus Diapherotrites archaeon]|uniref:Translation initiation factor IF-5A n=1 Tax=Candidatus Iainarchaeum sp. TaxID=3101447 RepID=A0A2D6M1F5_9ARCH|nr:translation initiation factor IF-5A [Candidatus Diapherotrites archaeon]|tara:strand:- start:4122 stop:4520 length:399 start_codon:yes stop_codon:yes gene_type:complete
MVDGEKKFTNAGSLKPGSFVLIEGTVCQVKSVDKSKPGKHGSAKVRIMAFDVFTDQKRNLLKGTGVDVEVPIIKRSQAQVVAIMGSQVQLMDIETYEMFNSPKPKNLTVEQGGNVEYIRWGDLIKVVRIRSE